MFYEGYSADTICKFKTKCVTACNGFPTLASESGETALTISKVTTVRLNSVDREKLKTL